MNALIQAPKCSINKQVFKALTMDRLCNCNIFETKVRGYTAAKPTAAGQVCIFSI